MARTVILYDGVCGLCDRFVQFILARDPHGRIRFAPLQGAVAHETLRRYGRDADDLQTVYVIVNWKEPNERLLSRSRAVLHAMDQLGGVWRVLARAARLVPPPLTDVLYRFVARVRYRVFGRYAVCQVPPVQWRARFLDRQAS
jgi:predicted DCC family thiol-disulfide oxidoreductase YuxK